MNAWSTEQQRLLAALGVPLFVRATTAAATKAAEAPDTDIYPFAALRTALERAAGGRNLAELMLHLPTIHASAAAKRALWPTLRAMRRGR